MKNKSVWISAFLVMTLAMASVTVFAQAPVIQNRIAQPAVIGGLRVDAAYVLAPGGGIQSFSCPSPQQYATPDGASQGWACFDAASNVWFLSALPPQQQAPAPAPVVVQQVIQQPVYQPQVIYAQPAIIYREPPRYIYATPVYYPRVVQRVYSPSVAIGVASINAAGRIAAAVIASSRFHDDHRNIRIVTNNGRHR